MLTPGSHGTGQRRGAVEEHCANDPRCSRSPRSISRKLHDEAAHGVMLLHTRIRQTIGRRNGCGHADGLCKRIIGRIRGNRVTTGEVAGRIEAAVVRCAQFEERAYFRTQRPANGGGEDFTSGWFIRERLAPLPPRKPPAPCVVSARSKLYWPALARNAAPPSAAAIEALGSRPERT